jgi:hypothetical protein
MLIAGGEEYVFVIGPPKAKITLLYTDRLLLHNESVSQLTGFFLVAQAHAAEKKPAAGNQRRNEAPAAGSGEDSVGLQSGCAAI